MAASRFKKITLILIVFFAALLVFAIYNAQKNPYGDYLTISNLDEYTSGKPGNDDRKDLILHNLHKTVNFNTKEKVENNSVKDVMVRKDSFKQTYEEVSGIHTVSFIVDIKSLRQSYNVSYQWNDSEDSISNIDEYGTQVTCVPLHLLKYGDFECKDERILERGVEDYDPVGLVIPYHEVDKFRVVDYIKNADASGLTVLQVEAYAPRWVARLDRSILDEYEEDIRSWLSDMKLDVDSYDIEFIY